MSTIAEALRLALSASIVASADARRCGERLAGKSIAIESFDQRLVIGFESRVGKPAVQVRTSDSPADATVRGSPVAVLSALVGNSEAVAILGDGDVFNDFRDSFRPHLELPPVAEYLPQDATDAFRVGARSARSAFEGLANAVRGHLPEWLPDWPGRGDDELKQEVVALRARVQVFEERLRALENFAEAASQDEPARERGGMHEGCAPSSEQ